MRRTHQNTPTAATHKNHGTKPRQADRFVPFETVEEAWFWFIAAQQARNDGARYVSGAGAINRPCEPVDILKVVDTLYRKRRIMRDHLLVLRHYGRRFMPPDQRRIKERRAHYLWHEAFERMRPILEKKGIITGAPHWVSEHKSSVFIQEELPL
ncbi:MAG: hypothetical protein ACLFP8_06380 [Alphaproteobacteria bacterium]